MKGRRPIGVELLGNIRNTAVRGSVHRFVPVARKGGGACGGGDGCESVEEGKGPEGYKIAEVRVMQIALDIAVLLMAYTVPLAAICVILACVYEWVEIKRKEREQERRRR